MGCLHVGKFRQLAGEERLEGLSQQDVEQDMLNVVLEAEAATTNDYKPPAHYEGLAPRADRNGMANQTEQDDRRVDENDNEGIHQDDDGRGGQHDDQQDVMDEDKGADKGPDEVSHEGRE